MFGASFSGFPLLGKDLKTRKRSFKRKVRSEKRAAACGATAGGGTSRVAVDSWSPVTLG